MNTLEERLKMYRWVKKNMWIAGLCNAIAFYPPFVKTGASYIERFKLVPKYAPEFWAKKPMDKGGHQLWWPREDRQSRLDCMDQCIAEVEQAIASRK